MRRSTFLVWKGAESTDSISLDGAMFGDWQSQFPCQNRTLRKTYNDHYLESKRELMSTKRSLILDTHHETLATA